MLKYNIVAWKEDHTDIVAALDNIIFSNYTFKFSETCAHYTVEITKEIAEELELRFNIKITCQPASL